MTDPKDVSKAAKATAPEQPLIAIKVHDDWESFLKACEEYKGRHVTREQFEAALNRGSSSQQIPPSKDH